MKKFGGIKSCVLISYSLFISAALFGQKSQLETKHHKKDGKDSVKGAGYYFDAGTDKAKSGDCSAAIDLYDKAILLDPDTYDAYFDRAFCKMQLQDYEAAIKDFTSCIRLHKGLYSNALYLRGSCFSELKRYDMAITDFTKALEGPSNADLNGARGLAYMMKGDFQNAVSDYTDAIAIDPDKTEFYGNRAICQYRLHHLKEAAQDAEKFLDKNPSSADIAEVEVRAEFELKDYPDALLAAQKLVAIQKSPKAYYYKGLIEFTEKKYQDGIVDFSSAISLDSTYKDAYYSRSLCYFALNDDVNACKDIRMAKKLGFPNLDGQIDTYCKDFKK